MRSQRLAPLSGIAFVLLVVIGFGPVGGDTPETDDSPADIASFWANHHDKEFAAAILIVFGALFLAIFVASLRDRARGAGGAGELWSNVILIGGSVAVAGFLAAVVFHTALADGGNRHISGDAMLALTALDANSFFAFAIPIGIMMLGAAGATIRTGVLPPWLGWAALVLGLVSFTPVGFIAFGLTGIWIVIASILMSRSAAPAPAAATA
jgi:hypothetical protein